MSIGLLDNLILVRTFFFIFPRDFLVFLCLPGPVCPIYLSVNWIVTVPKALDPIISLSYDRGEWLCGFSFRSVKQLALQLAKLLLQVWVFIRQGLQDRGVDGVGGHRVNNPQVLVAFQCTDIVGPEFSLLSKRYVLSVIMER